MISIAIAVLSATSIVAMALSGILATRAPRTLVRPRRR
jgi:hypothetical protein